jgi:hypothetical protein
MNDPSPNPFEYLGRDEGGNPPDTFTVPMFPYGILFLFEAGRLHRQHVNPERTLGQAIQSLFLVTAVIGLAALAMSTHVWVPTVLLLGTLTWAILQAKSEIAADPLAGANRAELFGYHLIVSPHELAFRSRLGRGPIPIERIPKVIVGRFVLMLVTDRKEAFLLSRSNFPDPEAEALLLTKFPSERVIWEDL